jgi:hypothetical protein
LTQAVTYRDRRGRPEDAKSILLLFGLIGIYESNAGRVSVHNASIFMKIVDEVMADVFPDAKLSRKAVQRAVKLYRSLS